MPLTRQGGYISASASKVTFFNTKGSWTQSQYTPYQTNYSWPKQFNTVMFSGHGSILRAIPWTGNNFGTEYTPLTVGTSGVSGGVAPHPSGSVVFAQGNTGGIPYAFPFSISTGFGAKWTAATNTLAMANNTLRCPPVGNNLFFYNSTNSTVYSIPFNLATSTFGTVTSVFAGTSGAFKSKFSRDGYSLAFGAPSGANLCILRIDPYTGTTNGANYATPTVLGSANPAGLDWTPAMDAMVIATSNGLSRHKTFSWTNANGPGTQYAAPAGFVDMPMAQAFFNTTGTAIFFIVTTTPFMQAYRWNSGTGFGTKYADPPSIPTVTSIQDVTLSASNDIIMVTISTDGGSYGVLWNDETGFGTSISYPGAGTTFARIVGAAVTL